MLAHPAEQPVAVVAGHGQVGHDDLRSVAQKRLERFGR